jgi:hypothetical protein
MLDFKLQHVLSRFSGFLLPSLCLWGKLQDLSFSKVSKQVVISFYVAGVALADIFTSLIVSQKSPFAQYFFAAFSEDELHFSWQACVSLWRPPS